VRNAIPYLVGAVLAVLLAEALAGPTLDSLTGALP
jgi:hypothetical protein